MEESNNPTGEHALPHLYIDRPLSSENTALREHIASRDFIWERDMGRLLHDLSTLCTNMERLNLHMMRVKTEHESQLTVRQEEVAAELTTLQRDWERKVSKVIQEKDDEITSVRHKVLALMDENLAKMRAMQTEMEQREAEWQTKYQALADCFRSEEETFKRMQELQKQSREMEERWLAKEEEWLNKTRKMKEEIIHLIQENAELRELALKAKMKKEEKGAKTEAEERLRKEREEEEERRERKKKEEHEKMEKERLKRENKQNEKREEKEREKTEREDKEKKETERMERNESGDERERNDILSPFQTPRIIF